MYMHEYLKIFFLVLPQPAEYKDGGRRKSNKRRRRRLCLTSDQLLTNCQLIQWKYREWRKAAMDGYDTALPCQVRSQPGLVN